MRDVFVSDAFGVDSAEPLDHVLEQLVARHIGSALVTKKGRLVGIFTLVDACRTFCEHLRAMFPDQHGNEVA